MPSPGPCSSLGEARARARAQLRCPGHVITNCIRYARAPSSSSSHEARSAWQRRQRAKPHTTPQHGRGFLTSFALPARDDGGDAAGEGFPGADARPNDEDNTVRDSYTRASQGTL
ncbi:hypothetical protein HPB50_004190 [Hyalomma asiaticum]|uniref:Uncharacterized protein n=1 Tax=Hyalomma asiaticum TaxID=266040 RepID=A0ACB7SYT9_HYAAI|nr:hypothetical protein HPB50_004190 [Hyalomma asiaticum]